MPDPADHPPSPSATLVPPRRLGEALRRRRESRAIELDELAARSDRVTAVDLGDIESGRRPVDDDLVAHLLALYGVDDAELLPGRTRLVIDLDEGLLHIDDTTAALGPRPGGRGSVPRLTGTSDRPPGAPAVEPDDVLARYLALVWRLRGVEPGTVIALRDLDVQVLADALELGPEAVERRLRHLLTADRSRRTSRLLRRRLLVPAVGVVVAATAVGVLVLVADDAPTPDPAPSVSIGDATVVEAPGPSVSIGDATVLEAPAPSVSIGDASVVEAPGEAPGDP